MTELQDLSGLEQRLEDLDIARVLQEGGVATRDLASYLLEESVDIRAWDLPQDVFTRARTVAVLGWAVVWVSLWLASAAAFLEPALFPYVAVAMTVVFVLVATAELTIAWVLRDADAAEEWSRVAAGTALGFSARAVLLLDAWSLSVYFRVEGGVLFGAAASVFAFALSATWLVQARLILALYRSNDWFSLDRLDRWCRRGRARRAYAPPDWSRGDELSAGGVQAIKLTNLVLAADYFVLYDVLFNQYVPLSYQETAEFASSVSCFTRCFGEDVVQTIFKVVFLLEFHADPLVVAGLVWTMSHHVLLSWYLFCPHVEQDAG